MPTPSASAHEARPGLSTPRVHVSLEVADLARSIAFYTRLLGVEPSKRRADYARFEPLEPDLNLSLLRGRGGASARGASHFGIQVADAAEVQRRTAELRAAGLTARVETGTTCCYATQDKAWVSDPDGNPWEVYCVLDDAPAATTRTSGSGDATTCCEVGCRE